MSGNGNVQSIGRNTPHIPGGLIHRKLLEVARAIENIPKKGYNEHHGYAYVRAVDIITEVKKLLIKNGIRFSVEDIGVEREQIGKNIHTKIKQKGTYFVPENPTDKHEVVFYSASADALDKDIFKAKTNGLKYHFIQEFQIPSDDALVDTEQDNSAEKNISTDYTEHPNRQRAQDRDMIQNYNQNRKAGNPQRQNRSQGQRGGGNSRCSQKQANYIMQMQEELGYDSDNLSWSQVSNMSRKQASDQIEHYQRALGRQGR